MIFSNEKIFVGLTTKRLDVSSAFDFINLIDCGGNSLFVGTTRGYEQDENEIRIPIKGLFYEAYESMAFKQMIDIANEIMIKNSEIKRCYIVHRLGLIANGEASIIIATCSKGRDDCSKETLRILTRIKEQIPVFKKIILNDEIQITNDKMMNDDSPNTSSNRLQTNWIMKSDAFWLKKD